MTDSHTAISALSPTRSVRLPLLHAFFLIRSSHEETTSRSSSRRNSFSHTLPRPWTFASFCDDSTSMNQSNHIEMDTRSSSDMLPLNHPANSSTSAWTRHADASEENGTNNSRFASGRRGWWKEQMLVDRSLRSMAALTFSFALIMTIVCVIYMPDLIRRHNGTSTSVGSKTGHSCQSLEASNAVGWTRCSCRHFRS